MKRTFVFLLSCLALAAAAQQPGAPAPSRAVYLLPMGYGLDQFLANHLSSSPDFHVVTDPKLADVIMTDRLGPSFEQRIKDLLPPPVAPAEPEPQAAEADKDTSDSNSNVPPQALVKAPPPGNMSAFSRGKGNVFLVDLASKQVIWSTFEQREGSASEDLERAAGRIVAKLRKDIKASAPKVSKHQPATTPEPPPAPAPVK